MTTIIEEDYVSPKTAELLKEKGMDVSCFSHYTQKNNNDGTSEAVTVCTLQTAMKWLREVHSIHIVTAFLGPSLKWTPTIWKIDMVIPESKHVKSTFNTWETYEEAAEAACIYVLKNLL